MWFSVGVMLNTFAFHWLMDYNNFNALPNNAISGIDNINKNNKNIVDITKTSTRSIQELASTFNYINK